MRNKILGISSKGIFVTINPLLFLFFQLRNTACYNLPRTDMG